MATFRDQATGAYSIGSVPPTVTWTVVKGDTAAFRVYVTDDNKVPLDIDEWDIEMEVKRPTVAGNFNDANPASVLTIFPTATESDDEGEFTVSLTSTQSRSLNTLLKMTLILSMMVLQLTNQLYPPKHLLETLSLE